MDKHLFLICVAAASALAGILDQRSHGNYLATQVHDGRRIRLFTIVPFLWALVPFIAAALAKHADWFVLLAPSATMLVLVLIAGILAQVRYRYKSNNYLNMPWNVIEVQSITVYVLLVLWAITTAAVVEYKRVEDALKRFKSWVIA